MTCGASIQIITKRDWAALDREVRDIMLRVWGVQPVDLGSRIVLTAGPPSAIERLRDSVEFVRMQTEPQLLELQAGGRQQTANLDWLDAFVHEHEAHEH